MIVFLIANKISSFGIRDEEEEWVGGLRERGEKGGETEEWDECRTGRDGQARPEKEREKH